MNILRSRDVLISIYFIINVILIDIAMLRSYWIVYFVFSHHVQYNKCYIKINSITVHSEFISHKEIRWVHVARTLNETNSRIVNANKLFNWSSSAPRIIRDGRSGVLYHRLTHAGSTTHFFIGHSLASCMCTALRLVCGNARNSTFFFDTVVL